MQKHILQDYLHQKGMSKPQADALAGILAEMGTRQDLLALSDRTDARSQVVDADMRALRFELSADMKALRAELTADMQALRVELKGDLQALKSEVTAEFKRLDSRIERLETRLTWRFVVGFAFFAAIMTAVDLFVD